MSLIFEMPTPRVNFLDSNRIFDGKFCTNGSRTLDLQSSGHQLRGIVMSMMRLASHIMYIEQFLKQQVWVLGELPYLALLVGIFTAGFFRILFHFFKFQCPNDLKNQSANFTNLFCLTYSQSFIKIGKTVQELSRHKHTDKLFAISFN